MSRGEVVSGGRVSLGIPIAIAICLVALAITTSPADAATTRAEYAAQANPICQSAKRPVFKAINAYVKALKRQRIERPQPLSQKTVGPVLRFGRQVAAVYTNITARLRLISPTPGDEQTVAIWLEDRDAVSRSLDAILRAYKKRKFGLGHHLEKRHKAITAAANAAGRPLGLQVECTPHDGNLFEFDPAN